MHIIIKLRNKIVVLNVVLYSYLDTHGDRCAAYYC